MPTTGYSGSDTLSLSDEDTTDGLTGTASVSITVGASAPTITAPTSVGVTENSTLAFASPNGISVSDPSATAEKMTLSVGHGTLGLTTTTGLTVSGNQSATVTLTGSLSNLNTALATLSYTPTSGYTGSDTLNLSNEDTTDDLTKTASVSIKIGAVAPTITAPAAVSVTGSTFAFTSPNGISIVDPSGTAEQLTLSVSHGTLGLTTTTGLTVSGNQSASVTLTGSLSSLNAALATLSYTPTSGYSGSDTLNLSNEDAADGLTGTGSVAITDSPATSGQVTVVSNHANGFVYGQTILFTATVNGGGNGIPTGTIQFKINNVNYGSPVTLVGGKATLSTSAFVAGQQTVTAVYTSNSSKFSNGQGSLTETVDAALLTVTASNETKVYGAALPALAISYSGFQNSDTVASLTTKPTASTTATAGSAVGSYPITVSGAVDPNYVYRYVSGVLSVTPATLTITANNQSMVSGAGAAESDGRLRRVRQRQHGGQLDQGTHGYHHGDQPQQRGHLSDHRRRGNRCQLFDQIRQRHADGKCGDSGRFRQDNQRGGHRDDANGKRTGDDLVEPFRGFRLRPGRRLYRQRQRRCQWHSDRHRAIQD